MDSEVIGLIGTIVMLALAIVGIPIGFAMGLIGFFGIVAVSQFPAAIGQLESSFYWFTTSYTMTIIPLFILMGTLSSASGVVADLFELASRLLYRIRGGLGHATVLASAVFSACTGSATATAILFGKVALPQMINHGYDKKFAVGCIASAGTMAALIPPSIVMVIYAILTEASIGKLLIAGIIPGIINAVLLLIAVSLLVKIRPSFAPPAVLSRIAPSGITMLVRGAGSAISVLIIISAVLGAIYTGFATPTQAGALGAFATFVIYVIRRRQRSQGIMPVLLETVKTSATLFVIIMGAILFSRFLTLSGVIGSITNHIVNLAMPPMAILLLIVLLYLMLGQLFSATPMLVMTLPVIFPVLMSLGFNEIWFGVVAVQLVEIASLTPPMALNVYAVASASGGLVNVTEAFKGVMYFLVVDFVLLFLIIFLPQLALWLPGTMA